MSAYLGELFALATAFCWSFTAVLFSHSGRQIGSDVVNRTRILFALGFVSLTHLLLQGSLLPPAVEPFRWGWLAVSSILGLVLGDAFLFEAYVLIGPRLGTLMMSAVPVISTLLAWLFLKEQVAPIELVAILLTVGGVAWVVTEKRGRTVVENKQYGRGLLFGFGGALGQALNLVTAKFALTDNFPAISASLIRILVAVVIIWALAAGQGRVKHIVGQWRNGRALRQVVAGTIVGPFLGIWFSLVAIQLTRVGIASTIMALPPVILMPLGYLLYRERVSPRGIIGTLVAFGGVALLFLV